MARKALLYLTLVWSVFTLQSCVSNYVVSKPMEYIPTTKLSSISNKKLNESKKALVSETTSKSDVIDAALASLDAAKNNTTLIEAAEHNNALNQVIDEAYTYLGTPYRYGGMTRRGIDCSAFVLSVFRESAGINLPRVAAAQAKQGERVDRSDLQKGDLVFFSHGRGIAHVGIVESIEDGDIKFIHASTSRGVMVSSLNDNYWGPRYRFAKRILVDDASNTTEENTDSTYLVQNQK